MSRSKHTRPQLSSLGELVAPQKENEFVSFTLKWLVEQTRALHFQGTISRVMETPLDPLLQMTDILQPITTQALLPHTMPLSHPVSCRFGDRQKMLMGGGVYLKVVIVHAALRRGWNSL